MQEFPFSQASENNKQVILEILARHLQGRSYLEELPGQGVTWTGTHQRYLDRHTPGELPGQAHTRSYLRSYLDRHTPATWTGTHPVTWGSYLDRHTPSSVTRTGTHQVIA